MQTDFVYTSTKIGYSLNKCAQLKHYFLFKFNFYVIDYNKLYYLK